MEEWQVLSLLEALHNIARALGVVAFYLFLLLVFKRMHD